MFHEYVVLDNQALIQYNIYIYIYSVCVCVSCYSVTTLCACEKICAHTKKQ